MKSNDKTLWDKIKSYISGVISKIKAMYKNLNPLSPEAEFIKNMQGGYEELLQIWSDAAVEASRVGEVVEVQNVDAQDVETDKEQVKYLERYQSAEENPDILSMIKKVESGDFRPNEKVFLGNISNDIAKHIQELTGINVKGFKVAIEARQIQHILKDHGKNGLSDHSMADYSNIAKMEYTLENPDDISNSGKTQAYTHMVNGRNKTVDTILYEKIIGEKSYYVVQAVPDTNAKTLFIVTAFIGKTGYKKEASQLINTKSPDVTAKTGSASASDNSISQDSEVVNKKFSDREYLDAVKSGDMETAQKMVDEAAKKAGYTIKAYHGTNAQFDTFDNNKAKSNTGLNFYGNGFYFTTSRMDAANYGKIIKPVYLRAEKILDLDSDTWTYDLGIESKKEVVEVGKTKIERVPFSKGFINIHYTTKDAPNEWKSISNVSPMQLTEDETGKTFVEHKLNPKTSILPRDVKNLAELAKSKGYDAIRGGGTNIGDLGTEYVVFLSSQIKSADPVTYDDDGNVIPLSERFNPDNVDIRYSARTPDDVSFTSRSLLANALESTAQNEAEKEKLAEYKGRIDMLNAEEKKLAQLKSELKELTFGKGEKCNNIFTFYDFLLKKIKKCSIMKYIVSNLAFGSTFMEIKKIVITGGPCAGKTTAMNRIQGVFTKLGYTVLFVPETATELITGGVAPWTCGTNVEYQVCQMQLQLEKERIFTQGALTMPVDKILLVCDRGALDNKAYMTQEDFDKVLEIVGHNEVELRDSYEAVFHLVTCAKGAKEFYTLENNGARTETVEQASALDDKIIASWTGHPHLRIIDNATDFEYKMKNLLDEMTSFLGEEAPRDIKRRFLIDYPDIALLESMPNCQRVEISQTYLIAPEGEENRVRQRGVDGNYIYFQTKKRNGAGGQRIRLERRLSKDAYIRLLMDADPSCRPIRKTRYCLTHMNQYFEIDVYPFWNDKAIIEIEQSDEGAEINFPDFVHVVREVTNDEAYKNLTLAKI